jgi:hypothetical protein
MDRVDGRGENDKAHLADVMTVLKAWMGRKHKGRMI